MHKRRTRNSSPKVLYKGVDVMLETEKAEIVPFNLRTGEIVPGKILTPAMMQEIQRKKDKNKKINEEYREYGNFYWLFYEMKEKLFSGVISGDTIARVIYLATYMNYKDNRLKYDNNVNIHKKDLMALLNIKERKYYKFIKDCTSANILNIEDDETVTMSFKYFGKGKIKKLKNDKNMVITRMYCDTIRYLYKNCNEKFYKNLSYLYIILPYINRDYNILCNNPEESNLEKIECINMLQLCNIVGYNPKNSYRLKQNLKNILIENKPIVSWVDNANGEYIFINPNLYYAGTKHIEVKILGKF